MLYSDNKQSVSSLISIDLLKIAQIILSLFLVYLLGQLVFVSKQNAVAETFVFPEKIPQETVDQLIKNGKADFGGRQLELARTDDRGDIIKTDSDSFKVVTGDSQQSILGAPIPNTDGEINRAIGASDFVFSENGQTADVSRDNEFLFKFKKSDDNRNEIWASRKKIIGNESWILQYYSQESGEWTEVGKCNRAVVEKDNDKIKMKRQCGDDLGTAFSLIYDFNQGTDPKVTFNSYLAKEGEYRLIWELGGIKDADITNDPESNIVRVSNNEGEMFFDYNDVFSQLGNVTRVEIGGDETQKNIKFIFDIGKRPVGEFILDPSFGYITAGTSKVSIEGSIRGSIFTASENGVASSISAYLENTSVVKNVKAAIYNHSNLSLIATTEQRSIPVGIGWQTFNFTAPKPSLLAGTSYLLVVWSQSTTGNNYIYYSTGTTSQGHSKTATYGNWPNPITSPSHATSKYSIYCTYDPSLISVSLADGVVSYGFVPLSASRDTTGSGVNDTQIMANDGNLIENFNIRGADTACPWTLATSAGDNKYSHGYCVNSDLSDSCDTSPSWVALSTSYQPLITGITPGQSKRVDFKISVPSNTGCFDQQNVDVVVQAIAP